MNLNNQNNYSKDFPKDDQEEEIYSIFYQKKLSPNQNQVNTEADIDKPIPANPENKAQNDSNKNSDKNLKEQMEIKPLFTEELKSPENEQKPLENEQNQQEIYDDCQNQNQANEQNAFILMDIEEEAVVNPQEFDINTNTTEVYTELAQNQTEINQDNDIDRMFNEPPNPNIKIPIQPWDNVNNMESLFDNGDDDLYDDKDEKLDLYGNDKIQIDLKDGKTFSCTQNKYG